MSAPSGLETNRLKRLTAYPKRFLADTALALTLSDLDADGLRADPTVAGHYPEAYAVQQLRPQADLIGATLGMSARAGSARWTSRSNRSGGHRCGGQTRCPPGTTGCSVTRVAARPPRVTFPQRVGPPTGQDTHSLADGVVAVPLTSVTGGA